MAMAGPVPVATVLGCDPVSHRSCVVVVRGRSRIRYENTGEKYSPIIISVKQTLQTSQTITTAMQQTNFLIGVDFPGCYNRKSVHPFYVVVVEPVLVLVY